MMQATSRKDMASDQTKAQATKATDTFCVLNSWHVNNYTCQVTSASDYLITLKIMTSDQALDEKHDTPARSDCSGQ